MKNLLNMSRELLQDSLKISIMLFKIMIPVSIGVKLLKTVGAVEWIGWALSPLMEITGLPGSMGLVWATGLLTNLYGGVIAYSALADETILTVGQVSILSTMLLMAHALPVELKIVQKSGPRIRAMALIRLGSALLFGFLMNLILNLTGWLQQPAALLWKPAVKGDSWGAWALSETQKLGMIFLIILGLLVFMKLIEWLRITDFIQKLILPFLRVLGIGQSATVITMIGITLGISYGGGLIIKEAGSGKIPPKEVFSSLALMSIFHSLIEDTMLMMALGSDLLVILAARMVFSLAIVYLIHQIILRVSAAHFSRYFYRQV